MSNPPAPPIDEVEVLVIPCPACGHSVYVNWYKGVVSDPSYVLIADWVYHSDCWDKQVEEFPP
jgi:hypothetical protein